jgi:hypothetical protein
MILNLFFFKLAQLFSIDPKCFFWTHRELWDHVLFFWLWLILQNIFILRNITGFRRSYALFTALIANCKASFEILKRNWISFDWLADCWHSNCCVISVSISSAMIFFIHLYFSRSRVIAVVSNNRRELLSIIFNLVISLSPLRRCLSQATSNLGISYTLWEVSNVLNVEIVRWTHVLHNFSVGVYVILSHSYRINSLL